MGLLDIVLRTMTIRISPVNQKLPQQICVKNERYMMCSWRSTEVVSIRISCLIWATSNGPMTDIDSSEHAVGEPWIHAP